YGRLSKRSQRDLTVFGAAICAAVCAGYTWYSAKEGIENIKQWTVSGALEVPIWPVTLLVPIVFAILTIQFVAEGVAAIVRRDLPDVVQELPDGLTEAIRQAEQAELRGTARAP